MKKTSNSSRIKELEATCKKLATRCNELRRLNIEWELKYGPNKDTNKKGSSENRAAVAEYIVKRIREKSRQLNVFSQIFTEDFEKELVCAEEVLSAPSADALVQCPQCRGDVTLQEKCQRCGGTGKVGLTK